MHRLSLAFFCFILPATLLSRGNSEVIYAYRNFQGISPIKMILVGEIKSKIKSAEIFDKDSPFQDYDTRLDQVMVRVVNREGIKPGQKLYVIDKNAHHEKYRNGLIIGEIIVDSILTNPFYGLALTGKGILLRVREGQFVARTLETENLEKALQIKRGGDALKSRGQTAQAISEYLKAISADVDLADAHSALADLYAKEAAETGEYPIRSISHYRKAFKHRQNFDTNLDRYRFYVNYLATLRQAREITENRYRNNENVPTEITDAIIVAEECMKISKHPDCQVEAALVYFDLMQFHSGRQSANDRTNYDKFRDKTGLLLKELNDTAFRSYTDTKDRVGYETGLPTFGDSKVPRYLYHRLAVLYYDALLHDSADLFKEVDSRSRLQNLIKRHLFDFDRSRGAHSKPDTEIEEVRRRILGDNY